MNTLRSSRYSRHPALHFAFENWCCDTEQERFHLPPKKRWFNRLNQSHIFVVVLSDLGRYTFHVFKMKSS